MRNDHRKDKTIKQGRLYGIGIGPGDPQLLTLKAKAILNRVDTIFVPKAKTDSNSYARSIIEKVIGGKKKFRELIFPMTKDAGMLEIYWGKAAAHIARELKKGKDAAFVTLGDPFIYSTYIYLLKSLRLGFPDIIVETVPGISVFNAASAAAQIPLVEGNQRLAVLPVGNDLTKVEEALKSFDTVVLMKIGAKLKKVLSLLGKMRLIKNAILVSRLGHADEVIIRDLSQIEDEKIGYFSIIIVKH